MKSCPWSLGRVAGTPGHVMSQPGCVSGSAAAPRLSREQPGLRLRLWSHGSTSRLTGRYCSLKIQVNIVECNPKAVAE